MPPPALAVTLRAAPRGERRELKAGSGAEQRGAVPAVTPAGGRDSRESAAPGDRAAPAVPLIHS